MVRVALGILLVGVLVASAVGSRCPEFITTSSQYAEWKVLYQYRAPGGVGTYSGGLLHPGYRTNPAYASSPDGTMWLFGGKVAAYSGNPQICFNDLWMLNPETELWTFIPMPGQTDRASVTGNAGNYVDPGAKYPSSRYGANGWCDPDGNFWLFGGNNGSANLGDMWKFDKQALTWEWVTNPDQQTVQSITNNAGVISGDNILPAARSFATATADKHGNFWVFGGENMPDLWRFNSTTRKWAMYPSPIRSINPTPSTSLSVYTGENPYPSRSSDGAAWCDESGNFWMFGGTQASFPTNVMWKFDVTLEKWLPKLCPIQLNGNGTYVSSNGSFDGAVLLPVPRSGVSNSGNSGKFYLLAGLKKSMYSGEEVVNDLWEYSPKSELWRWVNPEERFEVEKILKKGDNFTLYNKDYQYTNGGYGSAMWIVDGVLYSFGGETEYLGSARSLEIVELWKMPIEDRYIRLNVNEGETADIVPMIKDDAGIGQLSVDSSPGKGTAVIQAGTTHTLIYTANLGSFGTDEFRVKMTTPGCDDTFKQVKVFIAKQNPCTEAVDVDVYLEPRIFNGFAVPSKDLTYTNFNLIVTQKPTRGALVVLKNGAVRYQNGNLPIYPVDSFKYRIESKGCVSDEKTVTLRLGDGVRADVSEWSLY